MKLHLFLIFFVPLEIFADYFKWEILVAEKGYGTEFETIPLSQEGKIELLTKGISCKIEN